MAAQVKTYYDPPERSDKELIEADDEEYDDILPPLLDSSNQLIQEIQAQRDLRNAKDGNLLVEFASTLVNEVLAKVHAQYLNHQLAEGKTLTLIGCEENLSINTDAKFLIRSFGNLVKNDVEAAAKKDEIKIYASHDDEHVILSAQNPQVIPEVIQLQIFQRSFSTKGGSGRGIGTYSVKLLFVQYLNGKVFSYQIKKMVLYSLSNFPENKRSLSFDFKIKKNYFFLC